MEPLGIAEIEEKLIKQLSLTEKFGNEWAEAKASYEDFEDKKRSMLASLMPEEGSQAFKEQQAYKSEGWEIFCAGLSEARKKYLQIQVAYDLAKLKIEVLRSLLSTRREEMKSLG